jgi:hypothetical protein
MQLQTELRKTGLAKDNLIACLDGLGHPATPGEGNLLHR